MVDVVETVEDSLAWIAVNGWHWDLTLPDFFVRERTGFTMLADMSPKYSHRCVLLANSVTPAQIAQEIDVGPQATFDKTLQLDAFVRHRERLPTT